MTRFFEGAEACRVRQHQLSITPMKDFEQRIDPAFLYLITIAFTARLNQVCHNA